MIVRYFGGYCSIDHIRRRCGTSIYGTTLLGIYQAAQEFGFDVEGQQIDIEILKKKRTPTILHVNIHSVEHFVVFFGYDGNKFIIADPAIGVDRYSCSDLEKIWKTHTCLDVNKGTTYIFNTNLNNRPLIFFYNLLKDDFSFISIAVLLGFLISTLSIAVAVFSQKLIDDIIPKSDFSFAILGLSTFLFILLFRVAFDSIRQYIITLQGINFSKRLIEKFYNHLLKLPKIFYATRSIGDMTTRLNDTLRIQSVIKEIINNVISDVLISIVALITLFYYSKLIGWLMLVILPLLFFLLLIYKKKIVKRQRSVMVERANYNTNFIHSLTGLDTIKVLSGEDHFASLNKRLFSNYQKSILLLNTVQIKLSAKMGTLNSFIFVILIGIGVKLILNDTLKIGMLFAIMMLIENAMQSTINLAMYAIPIQEAKIAFERMYEFISIEKEKENNKNELFSIENIHFANVSFAFPGGPAIFKKISITFYKGSLNYITGDNGCGKSTLCSLLAKFYFPNSGEIIINNKTDIRDISLKKWRECIGILPQESFIFNGTLMDNLLLGNSNIKQEEVITFCKDMKVSDFFYNFPQGFNTVVGEGGIKLSGGQKQLVSLIRLLLRKSYAYILDEPTSAMDTKMKNKTMEFLLQIKEHKLIIVISHEQKYLSNYFDHFYLIQNGYIKEISISDLEFRYSNN